MIKIDNDKKKYFFIVFPKINCLTKMSSVKDIIETTLLTSAPRKISNSNE